jgi:hypothetical protein
MAVATPLENQGDRWHGYWMSEAEFTDLTSLSSAAGADAQSASPPPQDEAGQDQRGPAHDDR